MGVLRNEPSSRGELPRPGMEKALLEKQMEWEAVAA